MLFIKLCIYGVCQVCPRSVNGRNLTDNNHKQLLIPNKHYLHFASLAVACSNHTINADLSTVPLLVCKVASTKSP